MHRCMLQYSEEEALRIKSLFIFTSMRFEAEEASALEMGSACRILSICHNQLLWLPSSSECKVSPLRLIAFIEKKCRFEKSLYDLIRGLRNHKGNEREYIQHSLRECRSEIRGADMDLKATALLKLIYLEMFGHDMSWASFHVLEVMSCAKYLQKRVGYLAAVQSFRPDTEVLMLATNLLKKV